MGLGQGLPRGGSAGGARPRRPRGRGTVGGRSVWIRGVVEIKAPSGGAGAASADGPLGLRGGSARGARPGLRDQAGGASTAPHLRSRTPSGVGLGPLRRRRVPADSGIPPSRWSLRDLTPLLDPFGAAATDALAAVDAIRAGGSRGGASSRAEPEVRGHFVGLRGAGATLTGPGCGALAILAPRPGPAEALPPPIDTPPTPTSPGQEAPQGVRSGAGPSAPGRAGLPGRVPRHRLSVRRRQHIPRRAPRWRSVGWVSGGGNRWRGLPSSSAASLRRRARSPSAMLSRGEDHVAWITRPGTTWPGSPRFRSG